MSHPLKDLCENLMSEPFAKLHRLSDKSLDDVGNILSSFQEKFDALLENMAEYPELSDLSPSFEKSKELYCLIILKLEENALNPENFDSLSALAESENKTVFSHSIEKRPPAPVPWDSLTDEPFTPDLPKPIHESEIEDEVVVEDLLDHHLEHQINQPTSSITAEDPEPVHEERADFFAEEVRPEVASPAEPQTKSLIASRSPQANHYLLFAEWLNESKGAGALEGDFLDRVISQHYSFAIEAELHHLLEKGIRNFWGHRNDAVRALLDLTSHRFELLADLNRELQTACDSHSDWLFEKGFSTGAVLNSLRYMIGSKAETFSPTLSEFSTLFLFFGQPSLGAFELKNFLGIESLSSSEVTEISFRLSRIQKIKSRALSVSSEFNAHHKTTLEVDIKRVHQLVLRLEALGENLRIVA
jgi:hypothetical protein